jgi:hypothetical protein
MDTEYSRGFRAGIEHGRNQVLQFIATRLNSDATIEDVANEIEWYSRQDEIMQNKEKGRSE